MDSVGNQYLDEIRTSVRLRPIPWEGYVRANLLSVDEAAPFKALEKKPVAERNADVAADPAAYAAPLLALLARAPRDDVVKYLVLFAGDVFAQIPQFARALLAEPAATGAPSPWTLFAKILADRPADEQTGLLAARLVALMAEAAARANATAAAAPAGGDDGDDAAAAAAAAAEVPPTDVVVVGPAVEALLDYVGARLLAAPSAVVQDLGVQVLALLLQHKPFRPLFWARRDALVPRINELVASPQAGGLQVQYFALLALWLATFDKGIGAAMVTDYNTVAVLLDAAKASVKEKIVRVAVATLVNLTAAAPRPAAPALIAQRGLPLVTALADRKWTDEELQADIVTLRERLEAAHESMSTFDVYLSEVRAKHLQWSPPHRSPAFWKANAEEFRKRDWRVLRALVALLVPGADAVTEAVACHDITQIIAVLPDAVGPLNKAGAKTRIMELLNSRDVEVRYEALKATQAFIGHMFEA